MYQKRAFELHTHLYGCLLPEDLRWLASRSEPRWHIFEDTYEKTHGQKPDVQDIFADHRKEDLRRYSVYESVGSFPEFQCCFDFVISLAQADPDEVYQVARRVSGRQKEPYAEYRMLFGPQWEMPDYLERVQALCEGFEAEGKDSYLAMSLWRGGDLSSLQYESLKELMRSSQAVAHRLVAVDFCAQEEGFPPEQKKALFHRVHEDNKKDPAHALAILYHVGESFQDKSVESAARWVFRSAQFGAHRLGHAIALGQDPADFLGTLRQEPLSERIAQLEFELELGIPVSFQTLQENERELERLRNKRQNLKETSTEDAVASEPAEFVQYTAEHVGRVRHFQNELMLRIKDMGALLEVCPTSNRRIAAVQNHPVHRFLEAGLPVVAGADDPGIFDTDLEKEFQILKREGLDDELEEMVRLSTVSSSPHLSGRK